MQERTSLKSLDRVSIFIPPQILLLQGNHTHNAILQFLFILWRRAFSPLPGLASMVWPLLVLDGPGLFWPQSWHGLVMPAGEGQHTCECARLGLGGDWARVLIT